MMLEYNIKCDKMKSELYINFKQTGQQNFSLRGPAPNFKNSSPERAAEFM